MAHDTAGLCRATDLQKSASEMRSKYAFKATSYVFYCAMFPLNAYNPTISLQDLPRY